MAVWILVALVVVVVLHGSSSVLAELMVQVVARLDERDGLVEIVKR